MILHCKTVGLSNREVMEKKRAFFLFWALPPTSGGRAFRTSADAPFLRSLCSLRNCFACLTAGSQVLHALTLGFNFRLYHNPHSIQRHILAFGKILIAPIAVPVSEKPFFVRNHGLNLIIELDSRIFLKLRRISFACKK